MLERPRLDELLVRKGLARGKREAQAFVRTGKVLVGERLVLKPGKRIPQDSAISVLNVGESFVSRGGDKLWPVLESWDVEVEDKVALDVGAGTGGFTV